MAGASMPGNPFHAAGRVWACLSQPLWGTDSWELLLQGGHGHGPAVGTRWLWRLLWSRFPMAILLASQPWPKGTEGHDMPSHSPMSQLRTALARSPPLVFGGYFGPTSTPKLLKCYGSGKSQAPNPPRHPVVNGFWSAGTKC